MADDCVDKPLNRLTEILAAIEHERWSHWQRYVHSHAIRQQDGSLVIPSELVKRWEKQMETKYEDLTNEERESDREQVRRYLPILEKYLRNNGS
jgi:hypothetical protein